MTALGSNIRDRLSFVERPAPDPAAWIGDRLGGSLWSKQREVLGSLTARRRTAVPSCHASGKTWLAAHAVGAFIDSYPVGDAFVITTAPSQSQVATNLWRELRRLHRLGKLSGRITGSPQQPQTWQVGDEIVAIGRKSADGADPEQAAAAFQGIHARHVLIVLDEAGGVPGWLWDAAEALMTGRDARILAIGNPAARSRFERLCAPGSGWHVIPIPADETPNFTGEEVPVEVAEQLVSRTWVEEVTRTFGADSSYVTARVHARFPESADDSLIEAEWIRRAQERDLSAEEATTPGVLSTDVARGGRDETVIYANRGGRVRRLHQARGHDLMRTTGRIVTLARELPLGSRIVLVVDVAGLGGGVVDRLREQRHRVVAFNGAERARRHDRFVNRRAESYWTLRELLRTDRIDLDPGDDELAVQLGEIRWKEDSRGRIQIESKDDMRKRGVQSPDRADAVAMSVATDAWRPVAAEDKLAAARREMLRGRAHHRRWMVDELGPPPWSGGVLTESW